MILFAVTVCLASAGTAECHREAQYLPGETMAQCHARGAASLAFLETRPSTPDSEVVFVGYQCLVGTDG
ncbi:MAG: hypothetical protein CMK96_06210 [Pseudomonas sp.]|nr:hypothetical protein [Pseudomonas sp.]QDP67227.1 MAG: hypothetical protein GOVbin7368_18 [Prokaryotic dsDNA virus sp.]|tara:strand:+ start:31789 stop:31995 length:207 start_codon:yes stop_codon:yes gene_type:complete